MARSPKKSTKRQSTRPTRAAAASFKNEDDFDAIQDDDAAEDEDVDMEGGSEDSADMLNRFLTEYRKREAKKVSARTAAFQTQKKALYAAARKAAKDLARDGTACLEDGKAKLLALKREEVSAEKYSKDVVPLWHSVEDSAKALLSIYPAGLEDLFPRRSNAINSASEMLRSNPTTRADALAECIEAADAQLHQSKLDETNAADASNLIKYYKNLLLS
ncbi:hypothetical protein DFH07DRAFT_971373 [Mycena maculata]|uniref:Uncharacterized protein n=1 Tax=Mycena maculata TaxID=230809 RepID=A0AAD7HNE8_9AGAR|nr:hypothetical protein DFH07DRAFT_971373 [Mycena maculata]